MSTDRESETEELVTQILEGRIPDDVIVVTCEVPDITEDGRLAE